MSEPQQKLPIDEIRVWVKEFRAVALQKKWSKVVSECEQLDAVLNIGEVEKDYAAYLEAEDRSRFLKASSHLHIWEAALQHSSDKTILSQAGFLAGKCYHKGILVSENLKKAVQYYTLSMNSGNAKACNNLGNILSSQGKEKEAIEVYKNGALLGHVWCTKNIIRFYEESLLTNWGAHRVDQEYAWIETLQQSANQGQWVDIKRMAFMALRLMATKDLDMTFEAFSDAQNDAKKALLEKSHYPIQVAEIIAQEEPNAAFLVSKHYQAGIRVTADRQKAIGHMRHAAELGLELAFLPLGGMLFSDNPAAAMHWLSLAKDRYDMMAYFYLGLAYKDGIVVEKNIEAAKYEYFGHISTEVDDGSSYDWDDCGDYPEFVDSDRLLERIKAIEKEIENEEMILEIQALYLQYSQSSDKKSLLEDRNNLPDLMSAAEAGSAEGAFLAGKCFHNGWIISKDIAKATKYYRIAFDSGNDKAAVNLGLILQAEKDIAKAISYFKIGIERGSVLAVHNLCLEVTEDNCQALIAWASEGIQKKQAWDAFALYFLGKIYGEGIGLEKDKVKAIKMMEYAEKKAKAQNQTSLVSAIEQELPKLRFGDEEIEARQAALIKKWKASPLNDKSTYYFAEDIPDKKLENAIDSYILPLLKAMDVDVDSNKNLRMTIIRSMVVLLGDDTLFGSAKNGFIITKNLLLASGDKMVIIPLNNVVRIEQTEDFKMHFTLEDGQKILYGFTHVSKPPKYKAHSNQFSEKASQNFLPFLQEWCDTLKP